MQACKSPKGIGGKKGKKVEGQLVCHACDVKTELLVSLEYHVNNWHTNIKWICEHDGCWHLFSTRQIFVSHVKKVHNTDIVHCNYCNEIYSTEEQRSRHENVHSKKEYKYRCNYYKCWKMQKCDFNRHLKSSCTKNHDCMIACVYCSTEITSIPQFIHHLNDALDKSCFQYLKYLLTIFVFIAKVSSMSKMIC